MKLTRYKKWLALALGLANGFLAAAQSNGVPGATDYAAFSRFITERNIFDPNRRPHDVTPRYRPLRPTHFAPTFTLVGIMSYEKGTFAFFDGNNSDLQKVLYQSDSNSIAGFTVAKIIHDGVTLQTADKKQTVQMKVGDLMHQEGSTWQLAKPGEFAANTSGEDSGTSAATDDASDDSGGSASPSAAEPNDILKKLMQQREQELK